MKKQRIKIALICTVIAALSGCAPFFGHGAAAPREVAPLEVARREVDREAGNGAQIAVRPKARAALSLAASSPLVALEDLALFRLEEEGESEAETRAIPPEVLHYLDLFSGEKREVIREHAELSKDVPPKIEEILLEKGLPREMLIIAFLESRFNPSVRSRRGDTVGMWQLEERTARRYGLVVNRRRDERKDPLKATAAAAQMLVELRERFGNWALALAAYNSGPFRVREAIRESGGEKSVFNLVQRGLLSQTTSDYLARFAALTLILGDPERYGFPREPVS